MKKLFILLIIASASYNVNAVTITNANGVYVTNTLQQSKWEELGTIQATDGLFSTTGVLYVRVLGDKVFYRVYYNGQNYSVTQGNFNVNGKRYNAKFHHYYFNL